MEKARNVLGHNNRAVQVDETRKIPVLPAVSKGAVLIFKLFLLFPAQGGKTVKQGCVFC